MPKDKYKKIALAALSDNTEIEVEENKDDKKNYHFNPITKQYVIYLKSVGRNVVLPERVIKSIYVAYSDHFGEPKTIEDIARLLKWPKPAAKELLDIFSINHSSLPITPYELQFKNDAEIIQDLEAQRKFFLQQQIEKEAWKSVQLEALKWREFQNNILAPVELFLKQWKPPVYKPLPKVGGKHNDDIFLTVLQDTHLGKFTDRNLLFSGKDYSTEKAVANINNYLLQIKERLQTRKLQFKSSVLILNGDIINSCLDEFTRRGTKLHCDYVNEQVFRITLNVLTEFIAKFSSLFRTTRVIIQKGNHESVLSYYLGLALKNYFKADKSISFEVSEKWVEGYRFNNIYAVISHSVSDTHKMGGIPKNGNRLKMFIQELLIQKPKELMECRQRICITGHYHSNYTEDFGSFQMFRFGSTVNADDHGEVLGYFNRPQQSCLILGKDTVNEQWIFYLD